MCLQLLLTPHYKVNRFLSHTCQLHIMYTFLIIHTCPLPDFDDAKEGRLILLIIKKIIKSQIYVILDIVSENAI